MAADLLLVPSGKCGRPALPYALPLPLYDALQDRGAGDPWAIRPLVL